MSAKKVTLRKKVITVVIVCLIIGAILVLAYFSFLMSGLFVLLTSQPTHRVITVDYYEHYYDFFNYSLVDFELVSKGTWRDSFVGIDSVEGRTWTLQFMRYDGTLERFYFSNGTPFNLSVALWARSYGGRQLNEIAQEYLTSEDFRRHFLCECPSVLILMSYGRDNQFVDYDNILDLNEGMQLYSITTPELAYWGYRYCITIRSCDHVNNAGVMEKLKPMLSALETYFGQEKCCVRFDINRVCQFYIEPP